METNNWTYIAILLFFIKELLPYFLGWIMPTEKYKMVAKYKSDNNFLSNVLDVIKFIFKNKYNSNH